MSKKEQNKIHLPMGIHLLIEFYGCKNTEFRYDELNLVAKDTGSVPIKFMGHSFGKDQGDSAVVIIAESHISVHTYPEFGYAAIDVFTCGNKTDPYKALKRFKAIFKPQYVLTNEVKRGVNQ